MTTSDQRRNLEVQAHVLSAALHAVDHRDAVLRVVADSANRDAAQTALSAEFGWDDVQARVVLDLQVQAFTESRRAQLVVALQEARELLA